MERSFRFRPPIEADLLTVGKTEIDRLAIQYIVTSKMND